MLPDVFWHERKEMAGAGKSFCFAGHLVINHAIARMDFAAAQVLFGLVVIGRAFVVLTQTINHGRASSKDLAEPSDHDRVMAGRNARGAQTCSRPERQCNNWHSVEVFHCIAPAGNSRDIGRTNLLKRLDRPAAACAVNHLYDGQFQLMRHLLGLHHLALDAGIGRAATNGEIVRRGDDRAAMDRGFPEQERGGGDADQIAVLVISCIARDLADFAEGTGIANSVKPRAGIHLAATMLARDFFRATHLLGERFASAEFFEFFFPGHSGSTSGPKAVIQNTNEAIVAARIAKVTFQSDLSSSNHPAASRPAT